MIQRLQSIIKGYFFTGLVILAPIVIVVLTFQWIFGGLLTWVEDVPLRIIFQDQSSEIVGFVKVLVMLGLLLAGVILISALGLLSRLYIGQKIFDWIKEGLERVPFFGAIYSSLNQLFQAFSNSGGKQFSRVVFIEYPRSGVWAVAFVTGEASFKGLPPGHISVFIPTVPNPTAGFHLMVKESEVIESDLKVDEAFKLILSLGVALPERATHGK